MVAGADLFRALEEHVLEDMGDARVAEAFVDRPDRVVDHKRHRGGLVALQDQEGHTVFERVPDNRELLAGGGGRGCDLRAEWRRRGGGQRAEDCHRGRGAPEPAPSGRRVGGGCRHGRPLPSWQPGQQKADRPPKTIRSIGVPHRVHGLLSLPYAWSARPKLPSSPLASR